MTNHHSELEGLFNLCQSQIFDVCPLGLCSSRPGGASSIFEGTNSNFTRKKRHQNFVIKRVFSNPLWKFNAAPSFFIELGIQILNTTVESRAVARLG